MSETKMVAIISDESDGYTLWFESVDQMIFKSGRLHVTGKVLVQEEKDDYTFTDSDVVLGGLIAECF